MPASMSRRAKDEDGEGAARRVVNMLMALKEQLGDETFQGLCERLCEGEEPEEAEAEDDDPAAEFTSPAERKMDAAKDAKRRAKDKKAKTTRRRTSKVCRRPAQWTAPTIRDLTTCATRRK